MFGLKLVLAIAFAYGGRNPLLARRSRRVYRGSAETKRRTMRNAKINPDGGRHGKGCNEGRALLLLRRRFHHFTFTVLCPVCRHGRGDGYHVAGCDALPF